MSENLEDFVPENLSAPRGQRYRPLEGAPKGARRGIHPLFATLIILGVLFAAFGVGGEDVEVALGVVGIISLVLLSIGLYFLPFLIAGKRDHVNLPAIFALNLLLGWTFIGWVVSLVWSLTKFQPVSRP